uniref:Uncharacterized protein n=1 Tax=Timema poppense TaxID=170557 RepID=A0A7R9DUH4_TIMPO|nr:unnamed protein product [Timema poppensis]
MLEFMRASHHNATAPERRFPCRSAERQCKHLAAKLLCSLQCVDAREACSKGKPGYSSPMASLVLADSFEKLPDQITYLYAKPYDLQKHVFSSCHFRRSKFSHEGDRQCLPQGTMNPPEGRCATPPISGSPDRLDKATLKVHLPNGGFNIVKFGDAIDVKVSVFLPPISWCLI